MGCKRLQTIKISIEITATQDATGEVHYTARIPQRAMALYVSSSGGWYKVEVHPLDTDARAVKIPTPFNFPAKIELRDTTFWRWIMGKTVN